MNEAQLREYYRAHFEDVGSTVSPLTINEVGGEQDRWPGREALSLTYCVSTAFGTDQGRAIEEMAAATGRWTRVANVRFEYLPGENGSCDANNADIDVPVRPWTSGGACAFFPSGGGCVAGTLVIDFDDLDTNPFYAQNSPDVTTTGVFTHELGHVLGFRHEHIRPEAVTTCSNEPEFPDWQTLTEYDMQSTMHYPWCGGVMTSDLDVTGLDAEGGRVVYGLSAAMYAAVL